MKTSGGFGTRCMTDLIYHIVKEYCIPDDLRKTILVCGSYRAIKLLEQPMKVLESVGKEHQMSKIVVVNRPPPSGKNGLRYDNFAIEWSS